MTVTTPCKVVQETLIAGHEAYVSHAGGARPSPVNIIVRLIDGDNAKLHGHTITCRHDVVAYGLPTSKLIRTHVMAPEHNIIDN